MFTKSEKIEIYNRNKDMKRGLGETRGRKEEPEKTNTNSHASQNKPTLEKVAKGEENLVSKD